MTLLYPGTMINRGAQDGQGADRRRAKKLGGPAARIT